MMPVYRYMDSYPFQGNQMSSSQYYPSFEGVPPLTKVDPSKTVVMNQPWIHPTSFNYSVPCYPCNSDGHFPGYYSPGSYSHSPAPQFHWCGHHPSFPGSFPVQYVPPPYYVKAIPSYDYDKPKVNGYHCCGCPNHSHNQKYGGSEEMVEQERNLENKMSHSLAPSQQENCPYPLLWIPPEYMKDRELNKPLESDGVAQEKSPRDVKPRQNIQPIGQEPIEGQSWFPLNMKRLQSLLQGDNGRTLDQKDADTMQQFPFPIIWMAPQHQQTEDGKEKQVKIDEIPNMVKDPVCTDNVFPLKLLSDGHGMNEAREIHEDVRDQVNPEPKEKSTNLRIIPVKQVEVFKERENSEGAESRGRAVSQKNREGNEMGKPSGSSARRDSSSPPKSKLPPVCLRVDPLPRKRSSSVSSRSPSPPGGKGKSSDKHQICEDSECRESTLRRNKEVEEQKCQGAAIQVVESKMDERKEQQRDDSKTGSPVVDSGDRKTQQNEANDVKFLTEGDKGVESADGSTTLEHANEMQETDDVNRCADAALRDKKKLSADEAACFIQSAYHGYQVRKWEPLKKLKQLAEVREQMNELREKIHSLESSQDLRKDEKQIVVIGEMIMRLLLKLDTIQGLHPSLRDARKSLARELVMLQEKIDFLAKAKCAENPSNSEEGNSRDSGERLVDDEILQPVDAVSKNKDEEMPMSPLTVKDEQKETVNVQLVAGGLESPSNEPKEEVDDRDLNSSMVLEQNQVAHVKVLQLPSEKSSSEELSGVQPPECNDDLVSEGQSVLLNANGSLHMDNSQLSKLEETEEVASKELVASAEEQKEKAIIVEGENNEMYSSSSTEHDESDTAAQAVELLNELPVGVIAIEEPLEHEPEKPATFVLDQNPTESSANEEVSNENTSEQHFAEGFDRVSSAVGSMDPVEDGKENDFTIKTLLGGDLQQTQVSEFRNESLLEETQQSTLLLPENGDNIMTISNFEEQRGDDQDMVYQATGENVNDAVSENQSEPCEQEMLNVSDLSTYQHDRTDSSEQEVLESWESTPMLAKHDEKKRAATDDEQCKQQHEISLEDSKKLVEENEKMREMVEKLIQSGKEQLAVISSLTGRMNDLERKLRKKKMKARRYRRAISSPSAKPSTVRSAV